MKLKRMIVIRALALSQDASIDNVIAHAQQLAVMLEERYAFTERNTKLISSAQSATFASAETIASAFKLKPMPFRELTCVDGVCYAGYALDVIARYSQEIENLIVVVEDPMDLVLPPAFAAKHLHKKNFPACPLQDGQMLAIEGIDAIDPKFVVLTDLLVSVRR